MTETIGQQLRQAREARSLTLEEVAKATLMRPHYLQALETDDFEALPSEVQARGFLRTYASYLGIKADPLLAALDGESASQAAEPSPVAAQTPDKIEISSESADSIFEEVGQVLQLRRELLGISLEDVERHTHLRKHYLQNLEEGNLDALPSPVQGRGMLSNYAAFLGLDPEPLLLRFADGLQARLALKQAARPQRHKPAARLSPQRPSLLRRMFSGEMILGVVVVVSLVAFVVWGALRIFTLRSVEVVSPTVPSIADVLLASPTPSETPTPQTPTPEIPAGIAITNQAPQNATEQVTPLPGKGGSVQVYVTVHQRAWVRVWVDGKIEYEGRVLPGTAYTFAGENEVEILTGNGAALQVFFQQEDLGPMGLFGQVVDQVYTPEGVQAPTPTVTPTATLTPRFSPTPIESPTPTGTAAP